MKNIFNESDRNELLARIEKLNAESKALWGTMNVAQMLAHASEAAKLPTGEIQTKSVGFPISLLGRLLKSKVLGEGPFRKNSPTAPEIKITDPREFQKEKANFISAIQKLGALGEKGVKNQNHPFFGKMTPSEWGRINYKHADHHLSQFGV
jgi:hypothetical protein